MIIIHVDMEYEARMIKEHLERGGVPAYFKDTPYARSRFALPGAIGINETGYDIYIRDEDESRAAELLAKIGYGAPDDPSVEINNGEEAAVEIDAKAEDVSFPEPAQPLSGVKGILLTVMLLVSVGMIVYIADLIFSWMFGKK